MKLSTRARYGTRVLLELAPHWGEGPVLLKHIAQRQQIPLPYLQQLIGPLVKTGIIRTTRGTRGEISLLKPPNEVRLSEAAQLLEGSIAPVKCVDNPEICPFSDYCVTRDIWDEAKKAVSKVLGSVTLQELAERRRESVWQKRLRK